MAEDLPDIRLPIDFDVDLSSLKGIGTEAAKAQQAIEALTKAREKLNEVSAAGGTVKRGKTAPPTPDEQEATFEKQRQQRRTRQASNDAASSDTDRYTQYSRQQQRKQEQQDFKTRYYGAPDPQKGRGQGGSPSGYGGVTSFSNAVSLAQGNAMPLMSSLTEAILKGISTPSASSLGGAAEGAASGGLLADLGGLLGGLGLGVGAGLFVNNATSSAAANRRTLGANVGGRFGIPQTYSDLLGGGGRFQQGPSDTMAVAQALGLSGVQGSQINSLTQSTLALGAFSGRKPSDLAGLTAALSVGGRQSSADVASSYAELVSASKGSKVSLDALIDSLKVLATTTGGLGLDYKAVSQIAAGQKSLPTGINLGSGLTPLMGATGFQALTAAGALGITPDQLLKEQGAVPGTKAQPAQLMSQLSGFVQRSFGKNLSGTQATAAEGMLSQLGLFNFSGLSDSQQLAVVQGLASGNIAAAMAAAGKGPAPSGSKFQQQGANIAAATTSAFDQAKIKGQIGTALGANQPGKIPGAPGPSSPGFAPGSPMTTFNIPEFLGRVGSDLSGIGSGNILGVGGNALAGLSHALSGLSNPFGGGGPAAPQKIQVEVTGTLTGPNGTKATITPTATVVNPNRTPKGHSGATSNARPPATRG